MLLPALVSTSLIGTAHVSTTAALVVDAASGVALVVAGAHAERERERERETRKECQRVRKREGEREIGRHVEIAK
jgi:hypothetical protein